jgi:hypothetical protein
LEELSLGRKEVAGKEYLVTTHLEKVFDHLLAPLGAVRPPSSIQEALALYLDARAERRFWNPFAETWSGGSAGSSSTELITGFGSTLVLLQL